MAKSKSSKAVGIKVESKPFLNPFKEGVNYKQFLDAVGSKSVAEYCKGQLTNSQIEWLKNDIKLIKK
jgi:hypothetical protein